MLQLANGKQQFLDKNGAPLAGGFVYHYVPNTTTPATTYKDQAGQAQNQNPVPLDSSGQAVIWGNGMFRQVVTDAVGVTIWDQVVNAPDVSAPTTALTAQLQSSTGAAIVGFTPKGASAVARTVQDKLRETVSVKDFGAKGDGVTDDTAAIQRAATVVGYGGVIYFPQGTYFVSATITLRGATKMLGDGIESTIIKRTGDYGDTFVCGTTDISEPARSFGAIKIRFQHGDPYTPNTSTMSARATKGAHIRLRGAQEALIEKCWFQRMPYSVYSEGGSWVKVLDNQFYGVYDAATPALQEGIAQLVASYSTIHGNPTTWLVKGNNFLGATFVRNVTYVALSGSTTVNRVDTIGSQYGFLIDGLEDLVCNGNYFGGQSIAEIGVINSAGGGVIDLRIHDNFFDGISQGAGISFAPTVLNRFSLAVSIKDNTFTDNLHAVFVNQNATSNNPSVYSLLVTGNTMVSGIGTQVQLIGADGFVVANNTVSDYNKHNVSATDGTFTTGIAAYGVSAAGTITDNRVGGGANTLVNDTGLNYCYVGVAVDAALSSVVSYANSYTGIRSGSNFYTGLAKDENQTTVTTGSYQAKSSDAVILINRATAGTTAIALPLYPVLGREILFKDVKGDAATNGTAITSNDSTQIDGMSTSVISANYGFRRLRFNGLQWNVVG